MSAPMPLRLVIVGCSLAGLRAAQAARREGFEGSVVSAGLSMSLTLRRFIASIVSRTPSDAWGKAVRSMRKPSTNKLRPRLVSRSWHTLGTSRTGHGRLVIIRTNGGVRTRETRDGRADRGVRLGTTARLIWGDPTNHWGTGTGRPRQATLRSEASERDVQVESAIEE
ncbi:hypothetical protein AB0I53_49100 [Saccharopolyspora sp. NPDC050389]|uniref:hypothetical protein n=1 Tax=Saccharopolyspora sp. NPDC050389 TaxID=3155516 RepID=UPI0033D8FA73